MLAGLADEEARRAIRDQLDRTWVVEAAAGTGKTTELVRRLVAVVKSGRGRLSSLVALTFTEKAAGEMKLRLRTELDRALLSEAGEGPEASRLRQALRELETARIGTIHAFCADLLRTYPVEAGFDPSFAVADEERTRELLERAFDRWFARTREAPPEGVRRVLCRAGLDEGIRNVRGELLRAARALVETRDFQAPYRRDPFDRAHQVSEAIQALRALATLGRSSRDGRDPLQRALRRLDQQLSRVQGKGLDVEEAFLCQVVRDRDIFNDRKGRGEAFAPGLSRAEVLEARAHAKARLDGCVQACQADLAACLFRELWAVVEGYETEKRRAGVLDFFDLLLNTRQLLREQPAVRAQVQRGISHVFVDEFQDTDPIQSEIMLLLSADDPAEGDPWSTRPTAGKLFVVGDPKQSIYRFRRADVLLYERVKQHLLACGAGLLSLSTSFRSLPAIQSLVNAAFAPLMRGEAARGEARYVPLSPFREARPGQPALVLLPAPSPYGVSGRITKTAIHGSLPDAVAAWVDWLVRKSGYQVREGGRDVPVEARHVCLLFRRFRAYDGDVTREYVRALEARRIAHVLAGGRSFFAREEVMALMTALAAIEWPDDALSVYATLRGPFVGFHDDCLLSLKSQLGHLSPLGPIAREGLEGEAREAADVLWLLRRLHDERARVPVAQTIASLLRALRAHAGVAIWPTGEQALGNVLRVLDMARSYERRPGATSFRGFVERLERQAELGEAAEASVVEESRDGVRIMTVHAAKGLEFPVVVLCDPTAPGRPEYASRHVDPERGLWAQPLCRAEPIELVENQESVRAHDQAELVRLLYVAVTRAKELLVVPGTGEGPIEGWLDPLSPALYPARARFRHPEPAQQTRPRFGGDSVCSWPASVLRVPEDGIAPGEHRPREGGHLVTVWDPHVLELARPAVGGLTQERLLRADETNGHGTGGLRQYEAFREERAALLTRSGAPSLTSRAMTELAAGAREDGAVPPQAGGLNAGERLGITIVDSGAERARRARGKRFGTLVHALLQHLDLLRPAGGQLDGLSTLIARTLGASAEERTDALVAVEAALAHPFAERVRGAAARGQLFRELPITLRQADGCFCEGVADLVLREAGEDGPRLVVVDYKTDAELVDEQAYARQLRLYAEALQTVYGEPVEAVLFRI